MPASSAPTSSDIVGFSAVVLLGYTLFLLACHLFIAHPSVTKKVIFLSYLSLVLFALAQTAIVGTYFFPRLGTTCICHAQWALACSFYICGLYALKFVYVERVSILNKHPALANPRITRYIKYVTISLIISCIFCVGLVGGTTGGECHDDHTLYGCRPTFHAADIYIAVFMICVDMCLFGSFCYKWWSLLQTFRLKSDNKILTNMLKAFAIQFLLTIVAMTSCVVDGVVNLINPDYSSLIIFCFDAALVASCNFAMIKESQMFMWKYLCWPCRVPSAMLTKGLEVHGTEEEVKAHHDAQNIDSKTTKQKDSELQYRVSSMKSSMQSEPAETTVEPEQIVVYQQQSAVQESTVQQSTVQESMPEAQDNTVTI